MHVKCIVALGAHKPILIKDFLVRTGRKRIKKMFLATAIMLVLYFVYVETKKTFWGEFMSTRKVCRTWGEAPFNLEQFKESKGKPDEKAIRAQMTCSLLRGQDFYIGESPLKIRELFGKQTGYYYHSDTVPTYAIGPSRKGGQDSWQIVFLLDHQSDVSKVVVHKGCCTRKNPIISAVGDGVLYIIAVTFELLIWASS